MPNVREMPLGGRPGAVAGGGSPRGIAPAPNAFGGGGSQGPFKVSGGGGVGGSGRSESYSESRSFLPQQANALLNAVPGLSLQGAQNINQLAADPYGNSLFTNSLNQILSALDPFLQRQQGQLTDVFRDAGGLRDTRYADEMMNLMAQQQLQAGGIAGNLANQSFSNLLQALIAGPTVAQQGLKSFPTLSESFSQSVGAAPPPQPTPSLGAPTQPPAPNSGQSLQDIIAALSGGSGGVQGAPAAAPPVDYGVFGGGGSTSPSYDPGMFYDPSTGTFHNQPGLYPGSTQLAGY